MDNITEQPAPCDCIRIYRSRTTARRVTQPSRSSEPAPATLEKGGETLYLAATIGVQHAPLPQATIDAIDAMQARVRAQHVRRAS